MSFVCLQHRSGDIWNSQSCSFFACFFPSEKGKCLQQRGFAAEAGEVTLNVIILIAAGPQIFSMAYPHNKKTGSFSKIGFESQRWERGGRCRQEGNSVTRQLASLNTRRLAMRQVCQMCTSIKELTAAKDSRAGILRETASGIFSHMRKEAAFGACRLWCADIFTCYKSLTLVLVYDLISFPLKV